MTRLPSLVLPALAVAVSLVFTWLIWDHETQAERHAGNAQLAFALRGVSDRIQQRALNFEQMLHGVQGLLASSKISDQAAFHDYVQALQLDANFSGIQAIGLVELVRASGKDRHEAEMRSRAEATYAIHPPGVRDSYAPIVQREPYNGVRQSPPGFDTLSEPNRRAALERARDTGVASLTGTLRLQNDTGSEAPSSFIMYLPLYAAGHSLDTIADRQAALVGWTYVSFRIADFMAGLFSEQAAGLDLRIFNGVGSFKDNLIYRVGTADGSADRASQTIDEYLMIGGRTWTLSMSARPNFQTGIGRNAARLIALGGGALSALLGLVVWVMLTSRTRALRIAAKMTRELRDSETRFRHLFENNGSIMMVIDPESGKIVSANQAAANYYGYPLEQLAGMPTSQINALTAEEISQEQECAMIERRNYFNFHHRLASGEMRDVEVYSTPTDVAGKTHLVSIVHDITERRRLEIKLEHLALHDPLTNLPNRVLFQDHLVRQSILADRRAEALGLLFIDLDGFKEVNDSFGHEAGDSLLVIVAERLRVSHRAGDLSARLGGDEFVMSLNLAQADPFEEAERVASRVLEALAHPIDLEMGTVTVTASVGIAIYPLCATTTEQCMRLADLAMYEAKQAGKGRYVMTSERIYGGLTADTGA